MKENLIREFQSRFHEEPRIFRAPGRINIIGEHTDYNEGFVLPGAIDKHIYVAVSKRADDLIKLWSVHYEAEYTISLDSLVKSRIQWANYILGVVAEFRQSGAEAGGFNLVIDGTVPLGAGVSSSAAVECATATALNEVFDFRFTKMQLARMAQYAEHNYAGVMCGIMDQFASMHGKQNQLMKLDCRSLEFEYIPADLKEYALVLLNTNVKHNLASSEYNVRRQQCEAGVALVKKAHPDVTSLRDVNMEMLENYVAPADPLTYQRCRFVLDENKRVHDACAALKAGDIKTLGSIMFAAHAGLRDDYAVSCRELDFLVDQVSSNNTVIGARMMGGGFGGCTINLVEKDDIQRLLNAVAPAYKKAMDLPLTSLIVNLSNGAEQIA